MKFYSGWESLDWNLTCERCFKTLEKVSPSFQLSVETRFPKKWAPRARLKNIDCLINNLSGRAGTLWLSQLSRWLKPACHQSVSEFDLIFFIFGSEGVRLAQRTWLISPLRPDDKSVIFMPRSFTSALQLHTLLKWLLSRGSGCLLLFFFKNHHSPSLFLFLLRICSQFPTCALINHLCWMGMHITALTAHADVW